jgi:hypothetical protein
LRLPRPFQRFFRWFCAGFFGVVDVVFCRGFCKIDCANVVLLRGKRGEVVVICVAKRGSNSLTKNGTPF